MHITQRRGLVVWVYSLRQLNALKKFGNISHISKRMKYVILYVNEDQIETILPKLNRLHFVRSIDKSYLPDIDMTFEHSLENSVAQQAIDKEDTQGHPENAVPLEVEKQHIIEDRQQTIQKLKESTPLEVEMANLLLAKVATEQKQAKKYAFKKKKRTH